MEPRPVLYSWGSNSYGQLGLAFKGEQSELPTRVRWDGDDHVEMVAGGGGHSLILDDRGQVWSCGWNGAGQLGLGHRKDVDTFHKVPLPERIVKVACGWDFTVLVGESGSVWGCGSNSFGQIGLGGGGLKWSDRLVPIPGLADVVDAACGLRHALFLDRRGRTFGCGSAKKGQLGGGLGAAEEKKEVHGCVVEVDSLRGLEVVQIGAGQHYSMVLTKTGSLYGLGDNKHGVMVGSSAAKTSLQQIKPESTVRIRHFACGWSHALVLLEDNCLLSWGRSEYGQLGRSEGGGQSLELKAAEIKSGSEHCLAVGLKDGKLYSWGWNEHGNCGDGTVQNISRPTLVKFPRDYSRVQTFSSACGHNFAYVIESS